MKSKNPFTHKINFNLSEKNENFIDWLTDTHGPGGIHAESKWFIPNMSEIDYGSDVAVHFRNSQDASVFALRWL